MVDAADKERMAQLEARLAALQKANAPKPPPDETSAAHGAELAWRMVIELVAGIGIGFGIGYGLDVLFGTLPIFLVLFTLTGFAAGVQTMMRTARAAQTDEAARAVARNDKTGRAASERNETGRPASDESGDEQRGDGN